MNKPKDTAFDEAIAQDSEALEQASKQAIEEAAGDLSNPERDDTW